MSVTYQQLLHDVAIRLNALAGTQNPTITGTYDTAVLGPINFKSADWPFGSLRDAILMAEESFAWAIADTANHPFRLALRSTTLALVDAANLPPAEVSGQRIIGVFGAVYDDTDHSECLEGELDEIERVRRLQASGALITPVYLYRLDGSRIRHTRTGVVIEVCTYDREVQLAAFNSNSNMMLVDVLEGPITARALSLLTKDGAFADQAGHYAKIADEAEARIRQGFSNIGPKAIPISAGRSA
jgi:hypothetical protein